MSTLNLNFKQFINIPYRIVTRITGTDLRVFVKNIIGLAPYIRDWINYNRQVALANPFRAKLSGFLSHYTLADRYENAGVAKGEYFHQDLWFARKIFADNPEQHWDIGSRIDGFIAHLLVFRSVKVIDIRSINSQVSGLCFQQGDITSLSLADNSIKSISCLHTIEHIGLGRYGDPIDPLGHLKGIKELQRILAPGGKLYFSAPIGKERVEFNAHRIFDPSTIIDKFSDLNLIDFAAINKQGDLVEPAKWQDFRDVDYACGLFVFEKCVN
ncbi:hypothetical protein DSM106972_081370 [Dulcicalothrix desertica PCC 7102]|uniref:DUF268 domain-containing protein n=1 Tax=Dulcicalothrix desertica PCC 7102 TaxID=232991 RepID=A0A433UXF4_9CYAN|nr:DUF268 domain-containing protein [Dulcicalothrix desertica]RUS98508.1 hypothetical protein DSM106972_081370 [Dulcicalothrix desertica PCC 7102]TWH54912.1 Methylase involved in ubiquinone/menaquinone biosynthesis [Dulcicalothrix desertica PCC 7102]